jgi:hypothetical protein
MRRSLLGLSPSRFERLARLRSSAPLYLVTAVSALLVVLGIRALLWPPSAPTPLPPPRRADAPSEDFALQFSRAYLTYDAARPAARASALAPFLPAGLDPDAGLLVASGGQRVRWAEVASDQPALVGGRVITVAAAVSTQRLPVYLAVTVRHDSPGGLSLAGYPSFVGAPAIDRDPTGAARPAVEGPALLAVIRRSLRNYLAGSVPNLEADLVPGAQVTLPTVALQVRHVGPVEWIDAPGSDAVLADLTAIDARGSTYELAYEVGIASRERPYVDFIAVIPTAS